MVAFAISAAACGGVVKDSDPTNGDPIGPEPAPTGPTVSDEPTTFESTTPSTENAPSAKPDVSALTYDGIIEHSGCIEPPCCTGGSADTDIEYVSKCKYIVKALYLCDCYDAPELDLAVRTCVEGYLSGLGIVEPGDSCSGMNCESITSCDMGYDVELAEFGMPPFRETCDRSPDRFILPELYENCSPR